MKIRNDSIELHVADDGDPTAPPILLLHGITSFGGTWEWIVPTLTERFRVLRLDFRGQATAAMLAQRHPDLVVAAVMEDPPLGLAGNPGPGDAMGDGESVLEGNSLLESFRLIRESAPQLQASGITVDVLSGILAAAPTASGGTFGELLHPDGIASMAGSLLTVDASVLDPVLTGRIGTFLDPDAPFHVPSLIVCADPSKPDAVADPTLAQHFADISPATEYVVIDGAGHLIHDERASRDRFRDAALGFIDRTTAGGAD